MLVFGAMDFAAAVTRIGKLLGYRVTVCDARPAFATPSRFPAADEIAAEIVANRTGAGARSLSTTDGAIHRVA